MEQLRVCMLTTFYPPFNFGGDGIAVEQLAGALARAGHDVTVVHDEDAYRALNGRGDPPIEKPANGVKVVRLRSGLGRISPFLAHQTGRPVLPAARDRSRSLELLVVLAVVAQRFRFVPVPGPPVEPEPGITLRPRHGIRMRVEPATASDGPAL